MNYTIEDLRGKYAEVGTKECSVFLDACAMLGVKWRSGADAKSSILQASDTISVGEDNCAIRFFFAEHYQKDLGLKPFKIKDKWTIHNNDKAMSELTDEQYGKLTRAYASGGDVEFKSFGAFCAINNPNWLEDRIYRIKQKSERELFIDTAFECAPVFNDCKNLHNELLAAMFDSGKFKLTDSKSSQDSTEKLGKVKPKAGDTVILRKPTGCKRIDEFFKLESAVINVFKYGKKTIIVFIHATRGIACAVYSDEFFKLIKGGE